MSLKSVYNFSITLNMEIRVVFTLVSILFIGICSGDNLVVKLHEGQIRGRTLTTNSLKTYYAFEDIPYATPPIGQLRFKPPQAHRGWTGILNTTKNEKMCIQFAENNIKPVTHIIQTEDCLVLNVYSPVSPNTQNKIPVLFWIHGGGLVYGHGGFYNPKYFMDYGVVVVTINYRLGPFGFLTTNNADIPGNNGLKDQVLALQWVQRNIGHFGGNPDQVTIFGESAGGVSVGYQILNRNAQNLFRAAIMQSGSALNNAYQPTPETPAFLMGKIINPRLNISTSSQLLAVLQNATTDSIIAAAGQVELSRPWRPIAENGNISGAIITAPMHESFIAGNFNRVPLLAGYNSEEVLTYFQNIPALRLLAESYDINPGRLISDNLNVADKLAVGTEIKALYTRGTFVADLGSLVRALSDLGFISGISKQAELTTNRLVPTYLFQFSYSGTARMYLNKGNISLPGAESVGHAEELFYMWDMGVPLTLPGDKLISTRLLTLFTNFVKTLNPTPTPDANLERITWQRASQMNLEYLNINGTLSMRSQPRNYQRVKEVYEKYIRPPLAVF